MSLIGKAKVCAEKVQKKKEPTKQCTTLQEKDCCSNQSFVKTGDDTIKKANTQLEAEALLLAKHCCTQFSTTLLTLYY